MRSFLQPPKNTRVAGRRGCEPPPCRLTHVRPGPGQSLKPAQSCQGPGPLSCPVHPPRAHRRKTQARTTDAARKATLGEHKLSCPSRHSSRQTGGTSALPLPLPRSPCPPCPALPCPASSGHTAQMCGCGAGLWHRSRSWLLRPAGRRRGGRGASRASFFPRSIAPVTRPREVRAATTTTGRSRGRSRLHF